MCTSSRRAALNANAARYGGDPRPIIVGCRPLQRTPSPVILVPGTAAWGGFWRSVGENLAVAGFHVLAIDLPPFGFSGRPSTSAYGRADQAKLLEALIHS